MKIQFKSVALGFVLAVLLLVGAFFGLWFLGGDHETVFREQVLPSGKKIKITQFILAWGVEHKERRTGDDQLTLEYVSSAPDVDETALDRETLEVFELMRPISEQWGFDRAGISVFPMIQRKGKYFIYQFTRAPDGKWTFKRESAKVFVND